MASIIDQARCLIKFEIGGQKQERKIELNFEAALPGNDEEGDEGTPGSITITDQ